MKELIPMDDYGVFADTSDTARANSLIVAQMFEKEHKDVLKSIRNLDCSEEFLRRNFAPISYSDQYGRAQRAYAMTRDGFTFLVMGYRGKKAARFKEAYIRRFNEMESFIRTLVATRQDFPELTENIKLLHDSPRPYHFSNECDMINRLVTGMTAKQFRETHGLKRGETIRPHLTDDQIWLMNALQKADIGLLISTPIYEERKRRLEWYKAKLLERQAVKAS